MSKLISMSDQSFFNALLKKATSNPVHTALYRLLLSMDLELPAVKGTAMLRRHHENLQLVEAAPKQSLFFYAQGAGFSATTGFQN